MRKSRFTEEQMVAMLRDADRTSVAQVARKHKVTERTIDSWRQKFCAMDPADAKRLRQLEAENSKLKRMLDPALRKEAAAARSVCFESLADRLDHFSSSTQASISDGGRS